MNDELVPGSFIFIPGFRDKKYQSKTKRGQTVVGLGEYVQVFIGMFVKLGITGKESSVFGGFTFPGGVTLVLTLLPLNSITDLISLF